MADKKKPQDHKPKTDDEATEFTYHSPYGDVTLPTLTHLRFGTIRQVRKAKTDEERAFALVETACDEASLAVVDQFTTEELTDFFEEWKNASGNLDVGESSASSDS